MRLGVRGKVFAIALGVATVAMAAAQLVVYALTDGAGAGSLVWGAVAGLAAVLAAAAVLSWWLSRTVRGLVDTATAFAAGDATRRAELRSADGLAGLAGSLERMADDLGRTVSALSAERARLSAVLDGMGEALIATDDQHRVTLLNRAAEDLLGVRDGVGRSLVELVRAPALLDRLAAGGGGPVDIDLPRAGRPPLTLRARVTRQSGGGWVILMLDVTELRRLETIRRDFVANVSHELRTPVSVVSANAETLLAGALDDREHAPRLLDAILRNGRRLSSLIGDLLDLSRLEAGRYALELGPVDVSEVAQRVVEALGDRANERGTSLAVQVDPDTVVRADAGGLQQILGNYVENAIKYTPPGSAVRVEAERRGDRVRVGVRDDGPGLEPRHRTRVFERFYRVDPGRSREMGGTGLGLAIVKHLADSMGGSVGVTPGEPRGSLFWVEFQAASAPDAHRH